MHDWKFPADLKSEAYSRAHIPSLSRSDENDRRRRITQYRCESRKATTDETQLELREAQIISVGIEEPRHSVAAATRPRSTA
jgi:hypothetical protein